MHSWPNAGSVSLKFGQKSFCPTKKAVPKFMLGLKKQLLGGKTKALWEPKDSKVEKVSRFEARLSFFKIFFYLKLLYR